MTDHVDQYRSTIQDALGRPIPSEGDLRVWLDDDLVDREAPEGWLHFISAREVCLALLTGRVVELSLDSDLSDDVRFGTGPQVIDFIDEMQGAAGNPLWPRDGISIHSANPSGRDRMATTIKLRASRYFRVRETRPGGQPHFSFQEPDGQCDRTTDSFVSGSKRDPERIRRVLDLVRQIWERNSDLRLAQLLLNEIPASAPAIYNFEDAPLEEALARRVAEGRDRE